MRCLKIESEKTRTLPQHVSLPWRGGIRPLLSPMPFRRAADQRATASPALAICSGRTGVELNSILKGASASDTALAITTGGEIALPSPTPLTPSGLSGEGEC